MKPLYQLLKYFNTTLDISDDRAIIFTNSDNITYETLNQKVISAAKHFNDKGIETREIVPILTDHSADFITAVLALWTIGAVPVPLNIKLSSSELAEQIKFLQSRFLLQLNPNIKFDSSNITKVNLAAGAANYSELEIKIDSSQTAVIMFTSGASGKPKAVELSFENLISSAVIGNKFLNQTSNDTWLASLPFYHIGGFSIIFRSLVFGTGIILPDELNLHSIIQSINLFNPTLVSFVTSQMNELTKINIHPNEGLRHVLLGGGFIDSNLMREALQRGWNVCKVYGSTETCSFVTVLSSSDSIYEPESAGRPIPPNEIFIFDENGTELPAYSEGEIVVKSPSLMKGYWNDDGITKQKMKDDLYLTGDIGYKDEDGYLYVLNRRTDLIVTGGENVNPTQIEEVISKFSKVKEVCVFGIEDEKWGQKIAAAIVAKSNEKFSIESLREFLADKIASFKIPKEIFFVDELPKTELGKVKREAIRKILNQN